LVDDAGACHPQIAFAVDGHAGEGVEPASRRWASDRAEQRTRRAELINRMVDSVAHVHIPLMRTARAVDGNAGRGTKLAPSVAGDAPTAAARADLERVLAVEDAPSPRAEELAGSIELLHARVPGVGHIDVATRGIERGLVDADPLGGSKLPVARA